MEENIGDDGLAFVVIPKNIIDQAEEGDIAVSYQVNDEQPSSSVIVRLDSLAPTVESLSISGDGVINGADDLSKIPFTGTTSGVEDGQLLTLFINGVNVQSVVNNNMFSGAMDLTDVVDSDAIGIIANVNDVAGNPATEFSQSITKDSVLPTVTITDNATGIATGDITYTFDFSEDVIGFTGGDIVVIGGSKGAFTQVSASQYTLVVSPSADSTTDITIDVASDVARDVNGNNNIAATQSIQAVDTQAPTVTISDNTSGTATGDVIYTFDFSEGVSDFTADEVTVTGGTKGSFTEVTTSQYTLVVSPIADSTADITVGVAGDVAQDLNGNNNTAATQSVQTVDTQVPTVTIIDNTPGTATGDVTYTFDFNEAVSDFTAADITVAGGSKGTFTQVNASQYTLVVSPAASSTTDITVDVAADVAQDANGNNNMAAVQSVQAVDTTAPSVIISDDISGTAMGDVTYTIDFSEDVSGFTVGDIVVTGGTKGTFTQVTASQYTLVVSPTANSTTDITVDVATDVAEDGNGNNNTAAIQSVQAVDTTAPSITISDNTPGTATGDVIYTFDFSEDVSGFTAGDIVVTGGTKGTFTQVSASQYTLVVTPDANSTTDITVDVAADVAQDANGNNNTAAVQSVQNVNTIATDTSVVVFDLVGGVSSDHSSGTFDPNVGYTIYIRVDSDTYELHTTPQAGTSGTWGKWAGADNLGADDEIIFVGTGSAIQSNHPSQSGGVAFTTSTSMIIIYYLFSTSTGSTSQTVLFLNDSGQITRETNNNYSVRALWNGELNSTVFGNFVSNGLTQTNFVGNTLTTQGLV